MHVLQIAVLARGWHGGDLPLLTGEPGPLPLSMAVPIAFSVRGLGSVRTPVRTRGATLLMPGDWQATNTHMVYGSPDKPRSAVD